MRGIDIMAVTEFAAWSIFLLGRCAISPQGSSLLPPQPVLSTAEPVAMSLPLQRLLDDANFRIFMCFRALPWQLCECVVQLREHILEAEPGVVDTH
jgi:hypothetical protein